MLGRNGQRARDAFYYNKSMRNRCATVQSSGRPIKAIYTYATVAQGESKNTLSAR